uniref:Uncharacterized protein n=1 Tax=Oryza glumipatula TaxID=40148 RepID=A0A0D9YX56_9ORYZ
MVSMVACQPYDVHHPDSRRPSPPWDSSRLTEPHQAAASTGVHRSRRHHGRLRLLLLPVVASLAADHTNGIASTPRSQNRCPLQHQ